jgi:hypothetical protein
VEVAIVDMGRGIRRSLRQCPSAVDDAMERGSHDCLGGRAEKHESLKIEPKMARSRHAEHRLELTK